MHWLYASESVKLEKGGFLMLQLNYVHGFDIVCLLYYSYISAPTKILHHLAVV